MRVKVEKIIEEIKCQDVIEELQNPWVSLAALVRKKDRSFRFCVDYQKVNAVTFKDSSIRCLE